MKKILMMAVMLGGLVSGLSADNNGILYYVKGLYSNSENVKNIISQSKTGASSACGPTSLLFLNNHFSVKETGVKAFFTDSLYNAQISLTALYKYLGYSSYDNVTDFNELKSIAKNAWKWKNVARMNAGSTIDYNVNKLINYLDLNIPALVVLDSHFANNPTKGSHNIDHIVIVYAYQKRPDNNGNGASSDSNDRQNDRIYFYDPYYGGNGFFTRGEISTAVNLTNFAFLKIAP